MRATAAFLTGVVAVVWLADTGSAYRTNGRRWNSGSISMQLQLQSASSGTLLDGSTNWNSVASGALTTWNTYLNGVSFQGTNNSSASIGNPNGGVNNIIWDDEAFGDPFASDTLAITVAWYRTSDNRYTEADVVFNNKFSWNSYRGNRRSGVTDMRRVALHEFGHVLGLSHPDDGGQSVSAIMNSRIGDLDSLQTDDTDGVQSIYGRAVPQVTDTLNAGGRLTANQTLVSANRRYRLLYQTDGNLVLYDDVDRTAPWATNTGGASVGRAELQGDGNFVLYDGQNAARFASNTPGNPNSRMVLQNDGNLVIYASNGQPVWDRHR
jgi:hypothetical protein